jgi:parvulin-like peptidyl-prolyl isomerase
MRNWQTVTIFAALACLCAGPVTASADDAVIGNLGTQSVKASDIKDFVDSLNPQQREQAAKDPKIVLQLVRSAIGRKLALEEAQKQGWDKKPDIAAQIARARDEVVLTTFLRSVGLPPANYPTEDDIKAAYQANRDRFMTPRIYHVAQIFIAEPPDAKKDAIEALDKKARDLAKKARAKGADFAALARSNSDDQPSAPNGGDLGWLPENQILPEILAAVRPLGDKGVSDAVHAAGGWHILTVLGTKPPEFRPINQVRDQIVALLRETKIAQNDQAYVEKLLDDKHLTVNETAAQALFKQTP